MPCPNPTLLSTFNVFYSSEEKQNEEASVLFLGSKNSVSLMLPSLYGLRYLVSIFTTVKIFLVLIPFFTMFTHDSDDFKYKHLDFFFCRAKHQWSSDFLTGQYFIPSLIYLLLWYVTGNSESASTNWSLYTVPVLIINKPFKGYP